jgi:hypothetical protein
MPLEVILFFSPRLRVFKESNSYDSSYAWFATLNPRKVANAAGLAKNSRKPCQVKNELFYTFF